MVQPDGGIQEKKVKDGTQWNRANVFRTNNFVPETPLDDSNSTPKETREQMSNRW